MITRRPIGALCLLLLAPTGLAACGSNNLPESTEAPAPSMEPVTVTETIADEGDDEGADNAAEAPPEEPDAPAAPDRGPCEWQDQTTAQPGELFAEYCDGRFAVLAYMNSGGQGLSKWNGSEWVPTEPDNRDPISNYGCWDGNALLEEGADKEIFNYLSICQ